MSQPFANRKSVVGHLVAVGHGAGVTEIVDDEQWRAFNIQCEEFGRVRGSTSSYAGEMMVELAMPGSADQDARQTDRARMLAEAFEIARALTRAHGDVIRRHRAFNIPLVIWKDGRVQSVDPHSVPIPDPDAVQPRVTAS